MITQGKWEVRDYSDGEVAVGPRPESGFIPVCHIVSQKDDKADNARLIAEAPELLEACKELADIFPEESMSQMDAADFKDRATRIWVASQSAKNIIAKAEI